MADPTCSSANTESTTAALGPARRAFGDYGDALADLDAQPAAFAWALRQVDRARLSYESGYRPYYATDQTELFDALVEARLDHPYASDEYVTDRAVTALAHEYADRLREIGLDDAMSSNDLALYEESQEIFAAIVERVNDEHGGFLGSGKDLKRVPRAGGPSGGRHARGDRHRRQSPERWWVDRGRSRRRVHDLRARLIDTPTFDGEADAATSSGRSWPPPSPRSSTTTRSSNATTCRASVARTGSDSKTTTSLPP